MFLVPKRLLEMSICTRLTNKPAVDKRNVNATASLAGSLAEWMWRPQQRDAVSGVVGVQWHISQQRLKVAGQGKLIALIKIRLFLQ